MYEWNGDGCLWMICESRMVCMSACRWGGTDNGMNMTESTHGRFVRAFALPASERASGKMRRFGCLRHIPHIEIYKIEGQNEVA